MKKPRVFICYSQADSQFVDQLADRLNATGIDVWMDKWKIKVGDSITQKINEGISTSDCLIVVLSHASVNSRWVKQELNAALIRNIEEEKHAFILPALLEDCEIPTLLRDKEHANFTDDEQSAFKELLEGIPPPVSPALPFEVEGYCVKCRAKEVMKDAREVAMPSGRRRAAEGACPDCGTVMFKFLPKDK